ASRPANGGNLLAALQKASAVERSVTPVFAPRWNALMHKLAARLPLFSVVRRVYGHGTDWRRKSKRVWLLALVPVALLVAIPLATMLDGRILRGHSARVLTSEAILAIVPLEYEGNEPASSVDDGLLHEAFSGWTGITLVDRFNVADAVRRRGPIKS